MYIYCIFAICIYIFVSRRCQNVNLCSSPLCAKVLVLLVFFLELEITEIRLWGALRHVFASFVPLKTLRV